MRITPEQLVLLEPAAETMRVDPVAPRLDALTTSVLGIIGDALTAAGTLNRDLVKASASLLAPDAPSLQTVVAVMIERTVRDETSLAEATMQAQRLRADLNVIRTDASRDRLTGLVNRAATEEHLAAAVALPHDCCVAFVGIDAFATIKDIFGQGVGARVLKVVAATLGYVHATPHRAVG